MFNNFAINILEIEKHLDEKISINTYDVGLFLDKMIEVDIIPYNDKVLKFSNDIWSFKDGSNIIPDSKKAFKFGDLPECFVQDAKKYVLLSLMENKRKIQTINTDFGSIKKFMQFCFEEGIFSTEEITAKDILHFKTKLHYSNYTLSTQHNYITIIKEYFRLYSYNIKNLINKEITEQLTIKYNAAVWDELKNKTPLIPKEYFRTMKQLFANTMENKNELLDKRITASTLLLLSQTGLRISEIYNLKLTSIVYTKLHGENVPYLQYESRKSESGNNNYRIVDIFLNKVSEHAFKMLISLTKGFRSKADNNYLIIYPGTKLHPISNSYFRFKQMILFKSYHKELNTINRLDNPENLSTIKALHMSKDIKTLTFPHTIQYRVTVCTDLYEKGVPLSYIRKFMGHLTEEMEGYYVRNPNQIQEDVAFSQQTLNGIVSGDLKILGTNSIQMAKDIQRFIEENNFNVEKDLESIVEKLMSSVPVRAKLGGVCIKSSPFRDCTQDYKTNELFCAYNVCPNVFHFFYMCEVSYKQCLELEETIKVNYKNNHLRQVEKECHLLKRIVVEKLIPEMDELKIQLNKHSRDEILNKYPSLSHVIENYDSILKEVLIWKDMMKTLDL